MMDAQNEVFLKKLQETFAQEAKEHIDTLSSGLLELKKSSDAAPSKELVETLFREAHSFKGASRAVNNTEIEEVCKALEEVFSAYKLSGAKIPDPLIEAMLEGSDLLSILSGADEPSRRELKPQVQEVIERLHLRLEQGDLASVVPVIKKEGHKKADAAPKQKARPALSTKSVEPVSDESPKPKEEPKASETIRIPVKKLNAIMEQTEEMLFAKIVSKRHALELQRVAYEIGELRKGKKIPDVTMVGLSNVESMMLKAIKQAKEDSREINLMVDRLLGALKEALMLPFSTLFYTLPKIVHDMAKSVEKDALLNVIGGDIEIDRRILEQMHDPLIHLLRNAIDHGIESPQERIKKGKAPAGTITLSLNQKSGSQVELSLSDDGAGIDTEKIALSAVKKGLISQAGAAALDTESVLNLIFQSGVSTAHVVTDLSGRGLGLAIVRERAEQLGGQVHVENKKEGGTEFTLLLPLSMSTFRGVVTSAGNQKFIFPSEHIVRVMNVEDDAIKNVEGKEMIMVDHQVVPLYQLSNILGLSQNESAALSIVVIESANEMAAIGVEGIDYEEEVMVKSLGKQLFRVKNIAGAALLASDIPALILNISDILKSLGTVSIQKSAPKKEAITRKRRILVVDDSPTTRALLQNIMEMVGYDVVAAADGLDAYEALKKESFDVVVSDVDMPRMDGFELTESIRSDAQFSELPIILVTSLESAEDREKGMRSGANAYIVKSTFDQNNLIETIQMLIE